MRLIPNHGRPHAMRLIPNHGRLPVTLEDAQRAGRDRAWHDASTQFMKSAARALAHRSMEKQAGAGFLGRFFGSAEAREEDIKKALEYARAQRAKGVPGYEYVDEEDVPTSKPKPKGGGKLKHASEGDVGAILRGSIANHFGTRPALNELAQTENSRREPAVTDPQEDLPQIPAGRSVNPSPPAGQLTEASTALDRASQVYGLSKRAELEKSAWNPVTNFLRPIGRDIGRAAGAVHRGFTQPIGRDIGRAAGAVHRGFTQPIGQDLAAAGRRVKGALRPAKPINLTPAAAAPRAVTPQLATPQQAATFRPVGSPPPTPSTALAAPGGAAAAPGRLAPPAGGPAAPGASGSSAAASGKLSRKGGRATEIEGVQQKPKYKGPGLLGGLAAGGLLAGGVYTAATVVPAAARALENATAHPMAYGMGNSNLPYGYGQQEYTNF